MGEFCVRCSGHEGAIELLMKQHYIEMQHMEQKCKELQDSNAKLQNEKEALILDVAFYNGSLINLSCNGK